MNWYLLNDSTTKEQLGSLLYSVVPSCISQAYYSKDQGDLVVWFGPSSDPKAVIVFPKSRIDLQQYGFQLMSVSFFQNLNAVRNAE